DHGLIVIDRTAQGFGWFIDAHPPGNGTFAVTVAAGEMHAAAGSPALGGMDLLTVVAHELGHILLLPDLDTLAHPGVIMDNTLDPGVRRMPTTEFLSNPRIVTGSLATRANTSRAAGNNFVGLSSAGIIPENTALTA